MHWSSWLARISISVMLGFPPLECERRPWFGCSKPQRRNEHFGACTTTCTISLYMLRAAFQGGCALPSEWTTLCNLLHAASVVIMRPEAIRLRMQGTSYHQ